jgi:hypothetical protein
VLLHAVKHIGTKHVSSHHMQASCCTDLTRLFLNGSNYMSVEFVINCDVTDTIY